MPTLIPSVIASPAVNSQNFPILDANGDTYWVDTNYKLNRYRNGVISVVTSNALPAPGGAGVIDMDIVGGFLYAASLANHDQAIYSFDLASGTAWVRMALPLGGSPPSTSEPGALCANAGSLYVISVGGTPAIDFVFRWNGSVWTQFDGWFTSTTNGSCELFAFAGNLYAINISDGGKVYLVSGAGPVLKTGALWTSGLNPTYQPLHRRMGQYGGKIWMANMVNGPDSLKLASLFSWNGIAGAWSNIVPWNTAYNDPRAVFAFRGYLYFENGVATLYQWNGANAYVSAGSVGVGGGTINSNGTLARGFRGSSPTRLINLDTPSAMMPAFVPGL